MLVAGPGWYIREITEMFSGDPDPAPGRHPGPPHPRSLTTPADPDHAHLPSLTTLTCHPRPRSPAIPDHAHLPSLTTLTCAVIVDSGDSAAILRPDGRREDLRVTPVRSIFGRIET